MEKYYKISQHITFEDILQIRSNNLRIELSPESKDAIVKAKKFLDTKVAETGKIYYGINTGFGSFCNTVIDTSQLEQLQENLVKSHACGTGAEVPEEIVKLMLLFKVQSLSYGYSGVQLETVWRLVDMFNLNIL
ncbi:MAG: aromatic amino acid lyase, partial [Bacteroidetes bacterium]|nr:aromatic amino acid lyase [Bacteroidota bacterium]